MGSNLFGWYFMGFGTKMFLSTKTPSNQGFDGDLLGVRPSTFDIGFPVRILEIFSKLGLVPQRSFNRAASCIVGS